MAIRNLTVDFTGEVGVVPRTIRLDTTDVLATITQTNYLRSYASNFGVSLYPSDVLFASYSNGSGGITTGQFILSFSGGTITLIPSSGQGSVIGTANEIVVSGTDPFQIGIANNPVIPGSAAIQIPAGVNAERPLVPVNGDFRYNSQLGVFEGYQAGQWLPFDVSGGNVLSDGTASPGEFALYTTDAYHITASPLTSDGTNVSITGAGNLTIGDGGMGASLFMPISSFDTYTP